MCKSPRYTYYIQEYEVKLIPKEIHVGTADELAKKIAITRQHLYNSQNGKFLIDGRYEVLRKELINHGEE